MPSWALRRFLEIDWSLGERGDWNSDGVKVQKVETKLQRVEARMERVEAKFAGFLELSVTGSCGNFPDKVC
jgi:hypothetical protein